MWLVPPINVDLDRVVCNIPENDAPAWSAGVSYALGARVMRAHRVYTSAIADNLGVDPVTVDQSTDAAKWLEVGYTAARTMFDGVLVNRTRAALGAQAIGAGYVALGFSAGGTALLVDVPVDGRVSSVVLFGVSASVVHVRAVNLAGAVVYDRREHVAGRQISGWLDWFTVPLSGGARETVVLRGIPRSAVRVIVALEGQEVVLGEIVCGEELYVGALQAEGTGGRHVTASRYEFNAFGRLTFVQRPTRREITYAVLAEADWFGSVEAQFAALSGGLVAAIGSEARASTVAFGVMGTIDWSEEQGDFYIYGFTVRGVS